MSHRRATCGLRWHCRAASSDSANNTDGETFGREEHFSFEKNVLSGKKGSLFFSFLHGVCFLFVGLCGHTKNKKGQGANQGNILREKNPAGNSDGETFRREKHFTFEKMCSPEKKSSLFFSFLHGLFFFVCWSLWPYQKQKGAKGKPGDHFT